MKYDELIKQTKAVYNEGQEDACLVVYGDGDQMGSYLAGKKGDIKDMLATWMEDCDTLAELLLDVTSAYVKKRMVASAQGMDAKRKAYEETKKPS